MESKTKVLFDNLCVGDILFVESKDKAGILNILAQKILTNITLKEDFTYSHVILSLGKGLFIESNTKNGVTILTCIELSNKIGSSYKDNYKLFRNKIIASNNIMKRKIFMQAEYYHGQKYNKLFLFQKKRDGHAYCSQLIYNIYKDALNLKLKETDSLVDIFPIHIWNIIKIKNEWNEVTSDLKVVIDKIKEYQEKYQFAFIERNREKVLKREIVLKNPRTKDELDILRIESLHDLFKTFLHALAYKTTSSFFLYTDFRQTFYDYLYTDSFDVSIPKIDTGLDKTLNCIEKMMDEKFYLSCYIDNVDLIIIQTIERYSDKTFLMNRNDREVKLNFQDKPVVEKIIVIDKEIQRLQKEIYNIYGSLLKINTVLCKILQIIVFSSLENYSEIMEKSEKYVQELLPIFIWEEESLDEIINLKKLNVYLEKYKNNDFLLHVEPLISCRKNILIAFAEMVAKLRLFAEYFKIDSEYHLSINESIQIYSILDGVCHKENFFFVAKELGFYERERNTP